MDSIGQLTGGVAHDFNNVLTVITGTIGILADAVADRPELAAITKLIDDAAERGAQLTKHLLAFARKQPLQPREIDVNALTLEAAKLLHPTLGEQITIMPQLTEDAWPALVDPGQLSTAILNLALNARDAMPDGGKLTIQTADSEIDAAFAREHPGSVPGKYVRLTVKDTGTGIDPDIQSQIFEPFFTTKGRDKGTGLGLATVYGIVKQSNGYITVDSEKGKGASFAVYLPRIEQAASAPIKSSPETLTTRGCENVLLVEDAEPLRKLAELFLKENGYQVIAAADGSEALEVAAQFPGPIHLLLTDVVMPGINGRVLAERLAPNHPGMKVLYMSGYTDSFIAGHGVLEPGTHLLRKPFTEEILARKVRDLLDGKSDIKKTESTTGAESSVLAGPDDKLKR
jgi:CheY-like chemotaxis protein